MASMIEITQLSPTMKEGVLVEWVKKEGDLVNPGDVIASVETDKAVMDLEAFEEGILLSQIVSPSSRLPVGTPIGIIGEAGEDIQEILQEAKKKAASLSSGDAAESSDETKSTEEKAKEDKAPEPITKTKQTEKKVVETSKIQEQDHTEVKSSGRVKASPLAKKLSELWGVPLQGINGTGPGGRIVKRDVEAAKESPNAQSSFAYVRKEDQRVPLSMMRQSIAQRLTESKSMVPHFYLTRKVKLGSLIQLRKEINADLSEYQNREENLALIRPKKISINDFIIRANALALKEHPDVNAQWDTDAIILKGSIDIGIAVAIEDGLITPIIRDASEKNIFQTALEVKQLAKKARDRKLSVEEFTGGTFTISNLGMYNIDSFIAILNPPEAGLMAIGKSVTEPVYKPETGEFIPESFLSVTLSCDHRVVDGAKGAEYLETFVFFMEHPVLLL